MKGGLALAALAAALTACGQRDNEASATTLSVFARHEADHSHAVQNRTYGQSLCPTDTFRREVRLFSREGRLFAGFYRLHPGQVPEEEIVDFLPHIFTPPMSRAELQEEADKFCADPGKRFNSSRPAQP